jgi:damage-control phosphatase, subfamily III
MVQRAMAILGVLHVPVKSLPRSNLHRNAPLRTAAASRRMHSTFRLAKHHYWQSYDLFARQKLATFKSSRAGVVELAARYKDIITQLETEHTVGDAKTAEGLEKAEELLFVEMCEICLWGNATDLSLFTNLSFEEIQKLQGVEARKRAEKNVIVNQLSEVFAVLNQAMHEGKKERRVDFILDNAGFELYVDLVLAGYLLKTGLATTIVLHPKSMPWFVSDVVPKDFSDLISALADPQAFYDSLSADETSNGAPPLSTKEVSELKFLFQSWSTLHAEGQLVIRPNTFWTEGGSYWRLAAPQNKDLLDDLRESELVIFKGDLNYRKLVGDAMWDPTTPFSEGIGPLGPGSGLRVMALRTCKGDVVVGLPKGKDEELRATEGGGGDSGARKWAWGGKWAVVQFCDGK